MPRTRTSSTQSHSTQSRDKKDERWSARVTRESNALDLDAGVFTWKDPARIAASLKASAERSNRRKAEPYRSALSMLIFYINRAGKNLPEDQREILERAKLELKRSSANPSSRESPHDP